MSGSEWVISQVKAWEKRLTSAWENRLMTARVKPAMSTRELRSQWILARSRRPSSSPPRAPRLIYSSDWTTPAKSKRRNDEKVSGAWWR